MWATQKRGPEMKKKTIAAAAILAGIAVVGASNIQADAAQEPFWKALPITINGPYVNNDGHSDARLVSCEKHHSRMRVTVASAAPNHVRSVVVLNGAKDAYPGPQIYTDTVETKTKMFMDPHFTSVTSCRLQFTMQWW